ncbi:MAG: SRPBCC family protein [Candidatus Dormibacteraeota bacterium]|nr:SRPBCC family protein [Candidatus Dormibacteraeota bacterium]
MLLHNTLKLPIAPDLLVPLLEDLERIAPCLPGASIQERVDERTYKGRVTVKVGPVTVKYDGVMTVLEVDRAARRLVMRGEGRDPQGAGTASATITMTVIEDGAGGSLGSIESEVAITGRVAQFGRGLMQDVADRLLSQFATCLERTLAQEPSTEAPEHNPPPQPAPRESSVGALSLLLGVLWRRIRRLLGG